MEIYWCILVNNNEVSQGRAYSDILCIIPSYVFLGFFFFNNQGLLQMIIVIRLQRILFQKCAFIIVFQKTSPLHMEGICCTQYNLLKNKTKQIYALGFSFLVKMYSFMGRYIFF